MSHNFKVGDLALTLVDIPALPAGSVVELVEPMEKGEIILIDGEPREVAEKAWMCRQPQQRRNLGYTERRLMPLRGDHAPEYQKSQEVPA